MTYKFSFSGETDSERAASCTTNWRLDARLLFTLFLALSIGYAWLRQYLWGLSGYVCELRTARHADAANRSTMWGSTKRLRAQMPMYPLLMTRGIWVVTREGQRGWERVTEKHSRVRRIAKRGNFIVNKWIVSANDCVREKLNERTIRAGGYPVISRIQNLSMCGYLCIRVYPDIGSRFCCQIHVSPSWQSEQKCKYNCFATVFIITECYWLPARRTNISNIYRNLIDRIYERVTYICYH